MFISDSKYITDQESVNLFILLGSPPLADMYNYLHVFNPALHGDDIILHRVGSLIESPHIIIWKCSTSPKICLLNRVKQKVFLISKETKFVSLFRLLISSRKLLCLKSYCVIIGVLHITFGYYLNCECMPNTIIDVKSSDCFQH